VRQQVAVTEPVAVAEKVSVAEPESFGGMDLGGFNGF
jgi:hypothetical protein